MKKIFVFLSLITIFLLMLLNCPMQIKEKDDDSSSPPPSSETNIKSIDTIGSVGWDNSIAVSGFHVYISYYDGTNGDLKFAKSTDDGATWPVGNIKTVDSAGGVGEFNSIAVSGSNVYISYCDWTNLDLKFAKSTDYGANWLAENIKIVDSVGDVGFDTSIAISGSNLYISYCDITNDALKFVKSIDGGDTWPAENIKVVDSTGGSFPSIEVFDSNVYISFYGANRDLIFAKSTDDGATWPAENIKTIDSVGEVGWGTSIAVSGSNVYISYLDYTNFDLKFAKSIDGGASW